MDFWLHVLYKKKDKNTNKLAKILKGILVYRNGKVYSAGYTGKYTKYLDSFLFIPPVLIRVEGGTN